MTAKKSIFVLVFFLMGININLLSQTIQYTFPDESEPHEGTWLQWPHQYEYGVTFRNENDATWVAMTKALVANEKVHIIAYNVTEQTRISNLLTASNVSLANVDFKIFQTNDVWVRDNGPIYVRNASGNLVLQDWGFNGWGGDFNFAKCNPIPTNIASATGMTVVNLNNTLTIEGGSYEMDGAGTFIATKTAVLSQANPTTPTGVKSIRNLGKTQAQVEAILRQNLGATKFIWLDGWFSSDDITDAHIDGFAKFVGRNKLVTLSQADLLYWGASQADIDKLYAATNANNVAYTKVYIPLTANDVSKTNGTSLGYKGSYANYYVANNRVLVPNYNDPNDAVANAIIAGLYPGRTVVGIDCRNLYGNGGMVHCVTQQQPLGSNVIDTQAPTAPTNLVASGTTATTTNLSWTAATDNVGVIGYDVYQGTILKATVTTTSYSVVGLTASTAYSFSVKAKDAAGNTSATSSLANATTLVVTTTYCVSRGADASGEIIKSVVFGSINKTSTATIGYENFTTTVTNITKGSSYSITITPQWFYGTYAEGYAVFIDYNKDGDFADVGETVFTKTATTATSITGNITVPVTAINGITRMRIAMKYNGIPNACETFSYGQVEDYTLNIASISLRNSMPETIESKVSIFPNPANSEIELDGVSDNSTIEIYNSSGLLVKRIDLYLKGYKIQIADLLNGMYFIKCFESNTSSANSKTIKLIKQ